MDIEQIMSDYAKTLNPSKDQERRVFAAVQSRLGVPKTSFSARLGQLFNRRLILLSLPLAALAAAAFFVVPLFLLNNSLSSNRQFSAPMAITENSISQVPDKSGSSTQMGLIDSMVPPSTDSKPNPEDTLTSEAERAKIKQATITLASDDVHSTFIKVQELVAANNGYVNTSSYSAGQSEQAFMEVRIPAAKFDSVISTLHSYDVTIISEQIQTEDKQNQLTEAEKSKQTLADKIAQLQTAIAAEKDQVKKAGLEIQLQQAQSQLQAVETELASLQKQTLFSTLAITLQSKAPAGFLNLGNGWSGVRQTLVLAVSFWAQVGIWVCIPAIILLLTIILVRKFVRRRR